MVTLLALGKNSFHAKINAAMSAKDFGVSFFGRAKTIVKPSKKELGLFEFKGW